MFRNSMFQSNVSLFLVGLLGLVGCKDGIKASDIPDNEETGPMRIDMGGDATLNGGNEGMVSDVVDEVWIRIDEVSVYHETMGWVFVDAGRQDVNLMAQRDGNSERIGQGDVYIGDYTILRLSIVDSWIVVEGHEYDLTITNGADTNEAIEMTTAVNIAESTMASVWLGWDLDHQLSGEGEDWSLSATDLNVTVNVENL